MMKKNLCIFFVSALALVFFTGCGGGQLPDGMDTDRLEAAAKEVVDAANAQDYPQLASLFTGAEVSADSLESSLAEYFVALGEFEGYGAVTFYTGKNNQAEVEEGAELPDIAGVILEARYAEQTMFWRVVFTTEYELIGLWL